MSGAGTQGSVVVYPMTGGIRATAVGNDGWGLGSLLQCCMYRLVVSAVFVFPSGGDCLDSIFLSLESSLTTYASLSCSLILFRIADGRRDQYLVFESLIRPPLTVSSEEKRRPMQ